MESGGGTTEKAHNWPQRYLVLCCEVVNYFNADHVIKVAYGGLFLWLGVSSALLLFH